MTFPKTLGAAIISFFVGFNTYVLYDSQRASENLNLHVEPVRLQEDVNDCRDAIDFFSESYHKCNRERDALQDMQNSRQRMNRNLCTVWEDKKDKFIVYNCYHVQGMMKKNVSYGCMAFPLKNYRGYSLLCKDTAIISKENKQRLN